MATPLSDSSGTADISRTRALDNAGAGLGALLRCARERRGLTLEQISNETKLPRRHLEALEHDDLAAVPGEFYRRAEIRAYARAVDLDPNLAFARLEGALRPTVAREARLRTPRTHAPVGSLRRALIVIGVVVAAALFGRGMMEGEPAPEGDTRLHSDTGSPRPGVPPVREVAPHTAVSPSQGTPSDQVAPSSTPSGDALAAATEPSGSRASAASSEDLAVTTEQADARASGNSATELAVITQPAGARVTVDGIGWGVAPLMIRYLSVGDKRIRVSMEGYATEERVVHLGEGHSRRLDIRMRTAP